MASIHEAARRGFERQADAYERGRPGYPTEVTDWVVRALGLGRGRTVVDVGAGTGKLTRALLPTGAEVIAVEPVAEMRAVLERELAGERALEGTAESLPLDDASADAIVVGQAFHWFDTAAALAEFHRVLRESGRLGLLWTLRDRKQDLQRAIDEIMEPLRGDTPQQSSGAWRSALEQSPLFALTAELRVPFELELSTDTFVDRVASVSFVAALDDGRREAVLERVKALASEHREPWRHTAEAYIYDRVEES